MALEMSFDFVEMAKFQATLLRLEKLPQKVVNKAASRGATVAGRAVREAMPRGKTKQMSKAYVRTGEKSKLKGKKVFNYSMDGAKNHIFQKPIPAPGTKYPGKRRSSWNYAYYPSSVEYGFLTRSQGGGLRYVPGQHFVRNAAQQVRPQVERTIRKTLLDELEKEWQKKHGP